MQGPHRIGGASWWLRDGARPEALRPALERLMAAFARGDLTNRKTGRRKALYGLRLEGCEIISISEMASVLSSRKLIVPRIPSSWIVRSSWTAPIVPW